MRPEVEKLRELGPMPDSARALRESLDSLINEYERLIMSIEKPISDEEARVLVRIFGPDDAFGLAWPVVALIETAPGWPLVDCLHDTSNEWVQLLQRRINNAKARH